MKRQVTAARYALSSAGRWITILTAATAALTALAASPILFAAEPALLAKPVVAATEAMQSLEYDAGRVKVVVSSASTGGRYSLLELTELPGYMAPPHQHPDMDETFYVLEGTLELRLAGATHRLAAGSYVHIPRNTPHAQGSADDKPVKLLVTLSPGEFEAFFLDRVNLVATTRRDNPDFRRLYLEIVRKHAKWLQPATFEPAASKDR